MLSDCNYIISILILLLLIILITLNSLVQNNRFDRIIGNSNFNLFDSIKYSMLIVKYVKYYYNGFLNNIMIKVARLMFTSTTLFSYR